MLALRTNLSAVEAAKRMANASARAANERRPTRPLDSSHPYVYVLSKTSGKIAYFVRARGKIEESMGEVKYKMTQPSSTAPLCSHKVQIGKYNVQYTW